MVFTLYPSQGFGEVDFVPVLQIGEARLGEVEVCISGRVSTCNGACPQNLSSGRWCHYICEDSSDFLACGPHFSLWEF